LDDFLVPNSPYSRGGHHFTNGPTWVEQLARGMGLAGNVLPALGNSGTKASNYAVGGARAASDGPYTFDLMEQLAAYVADFGLDSSDSISPETLVVIEMGGNDIRDILMGANAESVITDALTNIGNAVAMLYSLGGRKFLLANVPAVGETPAIKMIPDATPIANYLTIIFNESLAELEASLSGLPEIDVRMFDFHDLLNDIIKSPGDFGITITDQACVTPDTPPFTCRDPDSYLFWDGIHPTKATHGIMARAAADLLNN
jgi:phospholipase/lecithinase/hemolysin